MEDQGNKRCDKNKTRNKDVIMEEMEKALDDYLRAHQGMWKFRGEIAGGLAVLDVLGLEKEKRIEVLALALGLCTQTATSYVNDFLDNARNNMD